MYVILHLSLSHCCVSLFDSFSAEQKQALDAFTQAVYAAKILDDIYKLIITR